MYCPRCGQQLASEIRFCSRCGLPMSGVAEVVANDGLLPGKQSASLREKDSSLLRGTRLGTKLIFLSVVLLPICLGLSFWADSPGPLFMPVTVFLVGFFWLIYSRLFGEEPIALSQQNALRRRELGVPRAISLSNHSGDSLSARAVDTGEFVEPPSVTDHTTRLIE